MDRKPHPLSTVALTLLLVGACATAALTPVSQAASMGAPPQPMVLQADGTGLVLSWRAPAFSTHQIQGDDGAAAVVEAPGWPLSGVPGEPALPAATAVAVVPPGGDLRVEVEAGTPRTVRLRLPLRLEPVPQVPQRYRQPAMDPLSGWEAEQRALAGPVVVEELGSMRGHRLVQVTFSPLSYDQQQGTLKVVDEVRVRISFQEPPQGESHPGGLATQAEEPDPFTLLLQGVVVNPDQVEGFAGEEEATLSSVGLTLARATDAGSRYKIAVAEEGLYELTVQALQSAGLELNQTPPDGLTLSHAGQEVAYQWDGSGQRILFYARPMLTRWAAHDVYWLEVGEAGTEMDERSGAPSGVTQSGTLWATTVEEKNNEYRPAFRSERDTDHWYWQLLSGSYPAVDGDAITGFEGSVRLLGPDDSGEAPPAVLTVHLQGVTTSETLNPDHRLSVALNGHKLDEIHWDEQAYHTAVLDVPVSDLRSVTTTLALTPTRESTEFGIDQVLLDAIELRYPIVDVMGEPVRVEGEEGRNNYALGGLGGGPVRIYDVSQLHAPLIVTDAIRDGSNVAFADEDDNAATYYILTDEQIKKPDWIEPARALPEPSAAPNYLIVSHSDFIEAVEPLAEHRRTRDGFTVHVAPVEAIYDVFGDGRVDPRAIKNYVQYAYEEWETEYLLLVGDGTHDPLNHGGREAPMETFIPPYLAMVDSTWGEAPSDNRFATLDGPDDHMPELFVGRLPVNTPEEAEVVVAKILAYDQTSPEDWNHPLLFFADTTDGITDFHHNSDRMVSNTHRVAWAPHRAQRIYYCNPEIEDCTPAHQISDRGTMTATVLNKLNQGALMATWTGHASWHQWGEARLFHVDDGPGLSNGAALPIFLQMTCFTSYFSDPAGDTLDEALLRLQNGGAIATWGPTSLGLTQGHHQIHQGFVRAIFTEEPLRLGPATVQGRLAMGTSYTSLWDIYILFGDPATELRLAEAWDSLYLPIVARSASGGS